MQWYGCCTHCYFCTPYFLSVSTHYKLIDGWQWVTKSAIVYMVTEQLLHNSQLVVDKNRHCPTRPSHPWLRSPSAHYWPFQNLLLSSQDRVWMNEWLSCMVSQTQFLKQDGPNWKYLNQPVAFCYLNIFLHSSDLQNKGLLCEENNLWWKKHYFRLNPQKYVDRVNAWMSIHIKLKINPCDICNQTCLAFSQRHFCNGFYPSSPRIIFSRCLF